jgi:Chaperone of endosialidase
MSTAKSLVTSAAAILLLVGIVYSQEQTAPSSSPSTITVTAAATADRVRFTAPGTVVQLRLEVYDANGEKLFDFEIRGGNVIDWHLQDGQAERLSDGSYLCVVTAKSLSGRMSQKLGRITIENAAATMQPIDTTHLTAQQTQAVGPLEANPSLMVLKEGENQTATVIAHDGTEGQITRGRGALSFRLGDFFSGKDTEQMRLTDEGNLGIGTATPQARLDVAGMIRSQGLILPDGSILTSAGSVGGLPGGGSDIKGTIANLGKKKAGKLHTEVVGPISGDGTVNTIAKFTGANTIANSALSEVGGNVGIGTASPTGLLHLFGAATADVFAGMGPDLVNGPAFNYGYSGSSFGRGSGFFNVRPDALAVAPNPSLRFMTANVQRMIVTNLGNIGIGTPSPFAKLDVVDTSGAAQIRFGNSLNDSGGYLISTDSSQAILSGGAKWDGAHFIAKGSVASLISNESGLTRFFTDSGLTSGSMFSPTERMRINSAGDVGIGTTTPARHLHVFGAGDQQIGIESSDVGGRQWTLQSSNGTSGRFEIVDRTANVNRLTILSTGNVGIGTTAPAAKLHIAANTGHILMGDAGCGGNNGIGFDTTLSGCNNYALLGNGSGTIINTPPNGTISFRIGDSPAMAIGTTGVVTINNLGGASGGNHQLCFNDSAELGVCGSSIRYKTNINPFNSGLNLIMHLRPVSFDWKNSGRPDFGLVAEDVANVEPLLVERNANGEVEGVKYDRVGVVLVNAVKEQQSQIEQQRSQIERQQSQIEHQQAQLKSQELSIQQHQTQAKQQGAQLARQRAEILRQEAGIDALKRLVCASHPRAAVCKRRQLSGTVK